MASGTLFFLLEVFGYKNYYHLANCYFYRGHIKSAIRNYEKGITFGDIKCMYAVAVLNKTGMGYAENDEQYLGWMRNAANSGHKGALGECYISGHGVEKDPNIGFALLKKWAKEHEESFAQLSVGKYYLSGKVVKYNEDEAKKWLRKAMFNNNPIAKEMLKTL